MISSVFIRRPITSTVLSIVIVIVGLVSLAGLPINQYPAITRVQVSVSASYPGAGAASRYSIGTGIIGGMVGATTLALFFVPLSCYLIARVRERKVPSPTTQAESADA